MPQKGSPVIRSSTSIVLHRPRDVDGVAERPDIALAADDRAARQSLPAESSARRRGTGRWNKCQCGCGRRGIGLRCRSSRLLELLLLLPLPLPLPLHANAIDPMNDEVEAKTPVKLWLLECQRFGLRNVKETALEASDAIAYEGPCVWQGAQVALPLPASTL